MIDRSLLRENPSYCKSLILKKDPSFPVDSLIEREHEVYEQLQVVERLRAEKNALSSQGPLLRTDETLRQKAHELREQLLSQEERLKASEKLFFDLYVCCPNLLDDDVPAGGKEANVAVKTWGEKPSFSFEPLNHVVLNEKVKFFDFQAAARMAGSQFVLYQGAGAQLVYALALYMVKNNQRHGYQLILPPYIVNEETLQVASNFPRFRDAVYAITEDKLFLTPTAEVNLTSLYRDHIFLAEELPIRHTAWTSCFRREAGSYGANERGLIRIHQFEKVELYTICTPQQAAKEHEHMLACAEALVQGLGLHYRISLLAAQDASFAAAKTYDIEVWMPGQKMYQEISSSSNCSTFQSRRAGIRYRETMHDKTKLVYTLNTSSLALPRLLVALMETYQDNQGMVHIPTVLKDIMAFVGG